jgi:hypothetical protein
VNQLLAQPFSGQKKWRAGGQGQFDCQHRLGFLFEVNVRPWGKQFGNMVVQHGVLFRVGGYCQQQRKKKAVERTPRIFVYFKGLKSKKQQILV